MKKNLSKKHILFPIIALLFLFALKASADFGFEPLATVPTIPTGSDINLGIYMKGLFITIVGLAIVFAVVMVVMGGVQYVIGGLTSEKAAGKKKIQSAVLGLLLILSSWVILNTINPGLLSAGLNIEQIAIDENDQDDSPPTDDPNNPKPPEIPDDGLNPKHDGATNLARLNEAGVEVRGGASSVNGMREKTVDYIIALQNGCDCGVFITPRGGTNGCHAGTPGCKGYKPSTYSHYGGYKADLQASNLGKLNTYVKSISTFERYRGGDHAEIWRDNTNAKVTYNWEGWWDIAVPL